MKFLSVNLTIYVQDLKNYKMLMKEIRVPS